MTTIKYISEANEHGLIVLEGNDGQTPYDNLVLYIEEDGTVEVDTRTTYTSNDGIPMDEWLGRTITFCVASAAGGNRALCFEDVRATLECERVQSLLKRIIDGHDVNWDGSNHRGTLTEDARDASVKLQDLLEEHDWDCGWSAWDAGEWLRGNDSDEMAADAVGLTDESSPEEIARLAGELLGSALSDRQWITGGEEAMLDALRELQNDMRQAAEWDAD